MGYLNIGGGLTYLALGIACLVMWSLHPTPCGATGSPPLPQWIFGTGISYTILGACNGVVGLLIACTGIGIIPLIIVLVSGGFFTFAWMIVGAVSLWRDGGDCVQLNFPLWQMGMAAVIISIVMVVFSGASAKSQTDSAQ